MENISLEMQLNKEALLIQANKLIRSMQDPLTLLENRLIKICISQIVMSDTELMTYTCHVTDLARFLDIPPDNIYRDMDETSSSILTKRIKIIDDKKPYKKNGEYNYLKFQWVSAFRYADGVITIRLNDELKPWLLCLHTAYTECGILESVKLPTSNSSRLFDLLKSYEYTVKYTTPKYSAPNLFPHIKKDNNEIPFSIDYLKEYFNCTDKYPATKDFIKRIIDSSVRFINTSKDNQTRISYRTVREGRKIAYVLFKINAWLDEDFREFLKNSL